MDNQVDKVSLRKKKNKKGLLLAGGFEKKKETEGVEGRSRRPRISRLKKKQEK